MTNNSICSLARLQYYDNLLTLTRDFFLCIDGFGHGATFAPQPVDLRVAYPSDAEIIEFIIQLCTRGHGSRLVLSLSIYCKIQLKLYGGYGYGHIERVVKPALLSAMQGMGMGMGMGTIGGDLGGGIEGDIEGGTEGGIGVGVCAMLVGGKRPAEETPSIESIERIEGMERMQKEGTGLEDRNAKLVQNLTYTHMYSLLRWRLPIEVDNISIIVCIIMQKAPLSQWMLFPRHHLHSF